MYTTPKIALAIFIMAFVGVVRGLWGSRPEPDRFSRHRRRSLNCQNRFSGTKQEPCFPLKTVQKHIGNPLQGTAETENGTARTAPCANRNRTEPVGHPVIGAILKGFGYPTSAGTKSRRSEKKLAYQDLASSEMFTWGGLSLVLTIVGTEKP